MPFNATKYRHVRMEKVFERRKIKILPVGSKKYYIFYLIVQWKRKKFEK